MGYVKREGAGSRRFLGTFSENIDRKSAKEAKTPTYACFLGV